MSKRLIYWGTEESFTQKWKLWWMSEICAFLRICINRNFLRRNFHAIVCCLGVVKTVLYSKVGEDFGIKNGENTKEETIEDLILTPENPFQLIRRVSYWKKSLLHSILPSFLYIPLPYSSTTINFIACHLLIRTNGKRTKYSEDKKNI